MTCLSCGALLDTLRSFCDADCEAFARDHGYGHYGATRRQRRLPESKHTRKDHRGR